MVPKKILLGSLTGVVLLLGTVSTEKSAFSSEPTSAFRRIEQPLAAKIGVAIAGSGLIALELWWFLVSKSKQL